MLDNEIKKALECCITNIYGARDCVECPLFSSDTCKSDLCKSVLDLINRLEAENERLSKENEDLRDSFVKKKFKDKMFEMTLKEYTDGKIKEFAKLLKSIPRAYVYKNEIDNALEELVGEQQ